MADNFSSLYQRQGSNLVKINLEGVATGGGAGEIDTSNLVTATDFNAAKDTLEASINGLQTTTTTLEAAHDSYATSIAGLQEQVIRLTDRVTKNELGE